MNICDTKLDETGVCFFSTFGIHVQDIIDTHTNIIYDVLSLQKNGLYLGETGRWKLPGIKKRGGHVNISRFEKKISHL